jgi:uncharacterized membrane protein YbhN (UPF0104 family)
MNGRGWLITRYAFAGIAIVALIVFVDGAALRNALSNASPMALAAGLALGYASWLLNTYKWRVLITAHAPPPRFVHLFRLNLVAALYGTLLPGQVAGEAIKIVRLSRSERDRDLLMASVLVDRVTGLVGLLIVGTAGAIIASAPRAATAALVGSLVAGTLLMVIALRFRYRTPTGTRAGFLARAWRASIRIAVTALRFTNEWWSIGIAVLISVVFQLMLSINVWVFARAIEIDIGLAPLAWIVAFVAIVQLLPITVAGIGTREGAFIALLATYGVPAADALALGLLLLFGNLSLALGGAVSEWLPDNPRRPRHPAARDMGARTE